jgi:hypothetical protein
MLTGWRPYSVKVGDEFYSYSRLDPLGMVLGQAADLAETSRDAGRAYDEKGFGEAAEKAAAGLVTSAVKNAMLKTWMSGISRLVEALDDLDRHGEHWLQAMAGTLIPTGMAQVAQSGFPGVFEGDPVQRETRTVLDTLKSRVPLAGAGLMPRRDL